MVSISTTGSSVVFTFTNCPYYLNNGTIEVPKNALALVIDSSDMVTFKKAASNDIFISVPLSELDMTKEEVEELYYDMCSTGGGSGSGVTSGEVQTMIDESISGKADSSAVTEEISAAVSGKQDTLTAGTNITIVDNVISATGGGGTIDPTLDSGSTNAVANSAITAAINELTEAIEDDELVIVEGFVDVNEKVDALSGDVNTLEGQVSAHTSNNSIHVTALDKNSWNAKLDASALAGYWTSGETNSAITSAIDASEYVTAQALIDLNTRKVDTSALTEYYTSAQTDSAITQAVSGKVDTTSIQNTVVSGSTNPVSGGAVYDQLGGVKIVALSQQAYDALAPDYDPNTLYIINS